MSVEVAIDHWLAITLPAGVAWQCCADPAAAEPLHPAEERLTAGMAPRRIRSFRHGRHCARGALAKLGLPSMPVSVSAQRAPVWPEGIIGSISHREDLACAVVARASGLDGIGIDLERTGGLDDEVAKLVCTAAERTRLRQQSIEHGERLLFTIKESVYKCLWPRLQRFIDFLEVEVSLQPEHQRFRARCVGTNDIPALHRLRGHYATLQDHLCAVSCLPPVEPGRG